ncbi:MAG: C1 family peptidase [Chloroflexota bacterium]
MAAPLGTGPTPVRAQEEPQFGKVNPDFIDFLENPPDPFYGYVPPREDLSHLLRLPVERRMLPADTLPSSFDWRDQGKVTPVKDQNPCGTCWLHGNLAAVEGKVLVEEDVAYDFSEQNLACCVDPSWVYLDGNRCHGGGSYKRVVDTLAKKGTRLESCQPYNTPTIDTESCDDSCESIKRVTGFRLVAMSAGMTAEVKQALYDHGPLTMVFYYDPTHAHLYPGSIYYYPDCGVTPNHCTCIVGWDDSIAHPAGGGSGAWIVKNSWGTGWGDGGYCYLCYGSGNMREVGYFEYEDYDPNTHLYLWDEAGSVGELGYGDSSAWMASIFTAGEDGDLTHVEFWTTGNNAEYEVYVYLDGDVGDGLQGQAAAETGTCQEYGYYSIELGSPVALTDGQPFTVAVKVTTPGHGTPIPVERVLGGQYACSPPLQSDVCFIRHHDWNTWDDAADADINVCLRARVVRGPEEPDISVSPSSFEKTLAAGTVADYDLTIGNDGGGTLSYTISDRETTSAPAAALHATGSSPSEDGPGLDGTSWVSGHAVSPFPLPEGPVGASSSGAVRAGWQDIVTEDFEASFPGDWLVGPNTGAAEAFWGKESYRAYTGTYSGFCAGAGPDGVDPPAHYPNNMDAWMVYGPFSLADATDAELDFWLWLDTEYQHDYLWVCASTGSNFYGVGMSGDKGGWVQESFDLTDVHMLGNVCGEPEVYVAFRFWSDSSGTDYGAFLDDVVLKKYVPATNNPPDIPSDPSPADDAIDVPVSADLSWTGGDPDTGDTVTYDVYLDTADASTLVSNDRATTTYDPGALAYDSTYFWKIVAEDNHGASTAGPLWQFSTVAAVSDCPWLTESPLSGSVEPAGSDGITVTFDTTGLATGDYTAEIVITSNDPDESTVVVPVTLHVTSVSEDPDIAVSPATFDTSLLADTVQDYDLTIGNEGGGTLSYTITDRETTPAPAGAGSWQTTTVATGNLGNPSLALNSDDDPHIAYRDWGAEDLQYARWNGVAWEIETVDSDHVESSPSLALDSSDRPCIVYARHDGLDQTLKYARWTGSVWQTETLDHLASGVLGWWPSLALDGSDRAKVSYDWDESVSLSHELRHARWNGASWEVETVEGTGWLVTATSLALDDEDFPHIAYYDEGPSDLKYARWNGLAWHVETVDATGNAGGGASLALDSNEYPHISYHYWQGDDAALKYARWDGASWHIETVDSDGWVGEYNSIALDGADRPRISYCDRTERALKYASFDGAVWNTETVDGDEAGTFTSLDLDGLGNPHIAYGVWSSDGIRYAWLEGAGSGDCPWLSETPASGSVGQGSSDVVTVTFDTTGLAPGDYDAEIVIDSNDPDESTVVVPVTLHVTSVSEDPDITVSPLAFDTSLLVDTVQEYDLTISNDGGATLSYDIGDRGAAPASAAAFVDEEPSLPQGGVSGGDMAWVAGHTVVDFPVSRNSSDVQPSGTARAGWQDVMTEGFEGSFPGIWLVGRMSGAADAYWGKESYRAYSGSYSGFCAGAGPQGVEPPQYYPNNMDALMIYGPFSLVGASDAMLEARFWLDTEAEYDYLWVYASTDGINFYGSGASGDSGGWGQLLFDLTSVNTIGNLCGEPDVWIAFRFSSDSSVTDHGAFLDDIVLKKQVATANNPPYMPSGPSPADYDTDVPVTTGLSWTGGDPDTGDTVTYDVYLDTADASTLVSNDQVATTYDPGTLEYGSTYFWKVVAGDNHGASTAGPLWRFTTVDAAADCPWLEESPASGSVAPGSSDVITVTFDTTGMVPGDYNAEIVITSNDPDEPETVVPVTLHVVTAGGVTVSVDAPAEVPEDSDFVAEIDISWVEDLDSCNYYLGYDSSVIEVTGVSPGMVGGTTMPVDTWGFIPPSVQGQVLVIQNLPGVTGVTGAGYLSRVHFHVVGEACQSSDLDLNDGVLVNTQASEMPATWVDASVHVSSYLPGDVNGDGRVNAADITKVERIMLMLDTETPGADVNGDGRINAADITKIERIMLMLD